MLRAIFMVIAYPGDHTNICKLNVTKRNGNSKCYSNFKEPRTVLMQD